ncbi:DUF4145 domain-containing protein [Micromonospora sp. WMMD1120]|uniref:DUF4145 domain-containing protein n=1 Tax=Micromonospora sp. WMMD1120 TaxID=3016106 RepID=UPI002416CE62|nr:DUF4145 domain-containing protein [Micromonospora sp. WMMD1120]MDG4807354.1 DUF4145 domain-containing protein [Micromonospora sp. WMMD1120]
MSWLEFLAKVIPAAIWPLTVLILVVVLRKHVSDLIGTSLSRIKAGPFEAEWNRTTLEAQIAVDEEIDPDPGLGVEQPDEEVRSQAETLRLTASIDPTAAIFKAAKLLEVRVNEVCQALDIETYRPGLYAQVQTLLVNGVISQRTFRAFDAVRRLRNLAVHRPSDNLTEAQALDFIEVVESLLEVLNQAEKIDTRGSSVFDVPPRSSAENEPSDDSNPG